MLELTGIASVLRGISTLYWLLAAGAVGLALWNGKSWLTKALWTLLVIVVFGYLPGKAAVEQAKRNAYAKEAWAYFRNKCDTEAGERIYKTYTGVQSVLVVKPLPAATEKDIYDQFWYGDPYSNATPWKERGEHAAMTLTMYSRRSNGRQKGLDFVEIKDHASAGYTKIVRPVSNDKLAIREHIEAPTSKFGVAWDDISTPEDRKYWVAGSRFRVIDLSDNTLVAERIGFFIEAGFGSTAGQRRPWLTSRGPNTTCPPLLGQDYSDNWFISDVFRLEWEK